MPNPIDINLDSENNPMDSLNFYWEAIFEDQSHILQFDNGIIHRFQEVKNRFDELKFFVLYNKNNYEEKFIIDLENGLIHKNTITKNFEELKIKNNIRLIYFRRWRRGLSDSGKELSSIVKYFTGFQYNDKLENNQKIILQIDNQGNFIIGV